MKKQLLNRKRLTQLFYSLTFTLLFANFGWSQTLFEETFGTTAAATFTGGTSSPGVNYSSVTTSCNVISTSSIASGPDMFLNFAAKALTTQTAATSTSTSVTLSAANALIQVGQSVTGSGLASGSTVTAINGTSLTLSAATTTTKSSTTLSFFSSNLSNRASLTSPLANLTSGLNTTKLTDNTKLVTWTLNMRASRSMSSSSLTYADGALYLAVVLCASTPNLTDGATSATDGYALILQRSLDNAGGLNPGAVRLVKFHNGIGSSTGGSEVSAALLTTPALNSGAVATETAPNNVSIKVEYNPNADSWTMYYREDPIASGFVDPSSGTLTKIGSITDNTYTSTAMTHFGYLAGLSFTTSAANQLQLNNFKIALSNAPAFTAAPVVEKRQAFNSTPTPTVASLVGTGTGTLNWYDVATGGTVLSPTASLVNGNIYYGSLTVGVTESDRVATTVYVGNTSLKTLPLYEPFNFTEGLKLVAINNDLNTGTGIGSWSVNPSAPLSVDDFTLVASPAWASTILPAAQNNAITFVGSGLDPELKFTNTTSGNLYSSFLYNAVDAPATIVASTTVGTDFGYSTPTSFYSFATVSADLLSTSYAAGVLFRKNMTTGKYSLGLSKSNSITECVWIPQADEFDLNTQHVIVIGYENIGEVTSTNQVAKLWIDPATSSTTPSETLSQNNPTTDVSRANIDRIKLLQASSSSTPTTIIDEIRVANNWGEALGGSSTLGLSSQVASKSQCTVYPNPVSNGKLYISSPSSSQKQVAVYSILGQKVLDTKTSNNAEINVSKLAKGNYILKITEDGKSEAKKLIVQ